MIDYIQQKTYKKPEIIDGKMICDVCRRETHGLFESLNSLTCLWCTLNRKKIKFRN